MRFSRGLLVLAVVASLAQVSTRYGASIYVQSLEPAAVYLSVGALWFDPVTHQLKVATSTGPTTWNVLTRSTSLVDADVPNATVAYVPCTGLTIPLEVGLLTHFRAQVLYTSTALTIGSAWAVTGPAFTKLAYASLWGGQSGTENSLVFSSTYNQPATSFESPATTTGNVAILTGTVVASAAGPMTVTFRSEAVSGTITCKAGSLIEWW
jgi:hypothetical protein